MDTTGRKEKNNTDYLEIPFKVSTSSPSFVGLCLANKHCMYLCLQLDQGEKFHQGHLQGSASHAGPCSETATGGGYLD